MYGKSVCGGLYAKLFYAFICTLFPYFLPFCYPYILLHFRVFLLLKNLIIYLKLLASLGTPVFF